MSTGGEGTQVTTLLQLIEDLDELVASTIYAAKPWRPESDAICAADDAEALTATQEQGFEYLLEIDLAREVATVWRAWRDGRAPTSWELCTAIIYYAETDAYIPVS